MAKITFTKLGLKRNDNIKTVQICGQDIEVKQYLPIQEKFELIEKIVNSANETNTNDFENPVQLTMYTDFEILATYTNINFTEKQREDITKTYDLLDGNKIFAEVFAWIPKSEYDFIVSSVKEMNRASYTYKNSIFGILNTINQDYSNLDIEATEIQKKLADPQNMEFLKNVLTKMG